MQRRALLLVLGLRNGYEDIRWRREAMLMKGAIYPIGDASELTREAWCQLVSTRPEFRQYPSREARNPFTGGMMTVSPTPDAAEVVFDDRTVGEVYWSMSEEPLVNVSVEPVGMPLVREWAAALSGEFRPDSPVED